MSDGCVTLDKWQDSKTTAMWLFLLSLPWRVGVINVLLPYEYVSIYYIGVATSSGIGISISVDIRIGIGISISICIRIRNSDSITG